jgi:hypothetical protein
VRSSAVRTVLSSVVDILSLGDEGGESSAIASR